MPEPQDQKDNIKAFKEGVARLRSEFDLKVHRILERIRLRKLEEIRKKIT